MAGAQLGLWAPVHGKAMVIGFRVFQTCPHLSVAIKQFFFMVKVCQLIPSLVPSLTKCV